MYFAGPGEKRRIDYMLVYTYGDTAKERKRDEFEKRLHEKDGLQFEVRVSN